MKGNPKKSASRVGRKLGPYGLPLTGKSPAVEPAKTSDPKPTRRDPAKRKIRMLSETYPGDPVGRTRVGFVKVKHDPLESGISGRDELIAVSAAGIRKSVRESRTAWVKYPQSATWISKFVDRKDIFVVKGALESKRTVERVVGLEEYEVVIFDVGRGSPQSIFDSLKLSRGGADLPEVTVIAAVPAKPRRTSKIAGLSARDTPLRSGHEH